MVRMNNRMKSLPLDDIESFDQSLKEKKKKSLAKGEE